MPLWSRKPKPKIDTGIRHTANDARQSVYTLTKGFPILLDSTFAAVSYEWLTHSRTQRAMRSHFWALPRYTSQAFDCENFATELVQWICRQAALAGMQASPEAFVICVRNLKPWAGIRDGSHVLNFIFTDREPIVIEP